MRSVTFFATVLATFVAWAQTSEPRSPEREQPTEDADKQLAELATRVAAASKIKLSGYVQGRYQYTQPAPGLEGTGRPSAADGFRVRRGRLKARYAGDVAHAMLQLEANSSGVTVKDAEAGLTEPWSGKSFTLVVGQTKWPFSLEVLQSSSEREMPERSRVVRAFAPGERDRGAKLSATFGPLRFLGGVFDGNGVEAATPFRNVDNDLDKDVVGRLELSLERVRGGVSAWYGSTLRRDEQGILPTRHFPRTRIAADAQVELNLAPLGATLVRGEILAGRTWARDGVEQFGAPAMGWYAVVVQKFLDANAVAFRYDFFDGARGTPDTPGGANNSVGTWAVAYLRQVADAVRVTLAFERPLTHLAERPDNQFTAQLQVTY